MPEPLCCGQTPRAKVIELDNGAEVNGWGFLDPVATQRAVGEQTGFSMPVGIGSAHRLKLCEKRRSIEERR
jgi:hypothetical protein